MNKILRTKDIKKYRDKFNTHKEELPVLDHCHITGHIRGVLDRDWNQFLGKLETSYVRFLKWKTKDKLPDILRYFAFYLEQDYTKNPLHPGHLKKLIRDFNKLPKEIQIELGFKGRTKAERCKQYRKYLLRDENIYTLTF